MSRVSYSLRRRLLAVVPQPRSRGRLCMDPVPRAQSIASMWASRIEFAPWIFPTPGVAALCRKFWTRACAVIHIGRGPIERHPLHTLGTSRRVVHQPRLVSKAWKGSAEGFRPWHAEPKFNFTQGCHRRSPFHTRSSHARTRPGLGAACCTRIV